MLYQLSYVRMLGLQYNRPLIVSSDLGQGFDSEPRLRSAVELVEDGPSDRVPDLVAEPPGRLLFPTTANDGQFVRLIRLRHRDTRPRRNRNSRGGRWRGHHSTVSVLGPLGRSDEIPGLAGHQGAVDQGIARSLRRRCSHPLDSVVAGLVDPIVVALGRTFTNRHQDWRGVIGWFRVTGRSCIIGAVTG